MKYSILSTILLITQFAFNQTVSYNDVAVIINDNSQNSIDIGNYFQQARNIPNQNMIHVFAPTTEEIDSVQFEQLRAQIENHLISNNLVDSINYIVTTKGVPLKMLAGCDPNVYSQSCGSVDAELTLILGQYSNEIHHSGGVLSPYRNSTDNFSRSGFGIYLVTRLDGYTKQDVTELIDRSGPSTGLNKQSSQAILDLYSVVSPGDSSYFANNYLDPAHDFLINNNWNVQIDWTSTPLTNQSNVFCAIQQANFPPTSVSLNYTWTEGSIVSAPVCASAETFIEAENIQNRLLIADLIREGCTGAHGNIGGIYYSHILNSDIMLKRYLAPNANYNLAESFYIATMFLSGHSVMIGDPKASIVIDNLAETNKMIKETVSIFPNPSNGIINIRSGELIKSCTLFDMNGRQLDTKNHNYDDYTIQLDLQKLVNGVYIIQIETSEIMIQKRIVLQN